MKQTTFWRCFLTEDSIYGLKHLTGKVTTVASLTQVQALWSTTQCPPHCKNQKNKDFALIFWSLSLTHKDLIFCQKHLEQAIFYIFCFTHIHLMRCLSSMVNLIAVTTILLTSKETKVAVVFWTQCTFGVFITPHNSVQCFPACFNG